MTKNFGDHLKNERELRGISLEEISHATKIHQRFLKALEDNQFDELPGEVFIKGYIRSYAQSIGSNESEILAVYDEACGRQRAEELEKQKTQQIAQVKQKARHKKIGVGVAGLAIIVGGFYLYDQIVPKFVQPPSAKNTFNQTEKPAATEITSPSPEQDMDLSSTEETQFVTPTEAASPQEDMSDSATPSELNSQENPALPTPPKTPPASETTQTASTSPIPGPEENSEESSPANQPEPPASPPTNEPEQASNPVNPPQEITASLPPEKSMEEIKKDDIIDETNINQLVTESEAVDPENRKVIVNTDTSTVNDDALKLKISVEESTWVNLLIDGTEEKDFILQPGEVEIVTGKKYFTVTIGNQRGTELALNGHILTLPVSGDSNVIRNFLISEDLIKNN